MVSNSILLTCCSSLPILRTYLQVVYAYDANETTHSESEIPWYQPLCGSFWSVSGFRQTHLGRICTHGLVCTLELLRIAPKGSAQVGEFLLCPLQRSFPRSKCGQISPPSRAYGRCFGWLPSLRLIDTYVAELDEMADACAQFFCFRP